METSPQSEHNPMRRAMEIMDSGLRPEVSKELEDAVELIETTVLSAGAAGSSEGILKTIIKKLQEDITDEYNYRVKKGENPDPMAMAKEELRKLDYKV